MWKKAARAEAAANNVKINRLRYSSELPASTHEVYAWHVREGALQRLLPPWKKVELLFSPGNPSQEGSRVGLKFHVGIFPIHWILQHTHCVPEKEFTDIQIQGPFRAYTHCHYFLPIDWKSCELVDELAFSFPFFKEKIKDELIRYLSWRHALLQADLADLTRYPKKKMRILLTGSTGLIGSHLKLYLRLMGHEVISLVRNREKQGHDALYWDLEEPPPQELEGIDGLIHLAGANIADKRWTKAQKQRLRESRCLYSEKLCQALCRLKNPPRTVIAASAIGYYGNRGNEELTEKSSAGKGFLADLCVHWEDTLKGLSEKGSRVAFARLGPVLSAKGGMLKKMLPAFQWGLGGRLGSGKQWISWIGIDDVLSAFYHILQTDSLSGPINLVAPAPVMQKEFAHVLAHKLHRPSSCPLPAWLLKAGLGEMADEMLLSSAKVAPEKLLKSGFSFRYPDLQTALHYVS